MVTDIIIVVVVVLAIVGLLITKTSHRSKPSLEYHYKRKGFIMTKAENDFFDVINEAVGNSYYVFPQVHLSEFLDYKVKGQNWDHALHYINQKSVDYLVCDKQYRQPLLAIELDDWSHESEARQQRDANVERMLREAELPLLRFKDVKNMMTTEVAARIQGMLGI